MTSPVSRSTSRSRRDAPRYPAALVVGAGECRHHQPLKERFGYEDWVRGGFLKRTSGNRTDYAVSARRHSGLDHDYRIEELAFDPAYSTQLVQELIAHGVNMVEHRQGTLSMTYPIKEFQRRIMGRDSAHGNNPLLTFMVDNLVVKSDGKGNLCCVKPDNPKSPRKIDGAVAAIMAMGRAAANPERRRAGKCSSDEDNF